MRSLVRKELWMAGVLVGVLLLIVIAQWLAPWLAQRYLNQNVLNDMGDYTGYVEDVDLRLLAGDGVLENLTIWRKGGNSDIPFVHVDRSQVSLSWRALVKGEISAEVLVQSPQINFLDAAREEDEQTGKGTNWMQVIDELFPIMLHEVRITDGAVSFQNLDTEPKVDLRASDINLLVTNLTNVEDEQGQRVASADLSATLLGQSPISAEAEFDPFQFDDFTFASEARDLKLASFNDFAKAYANLDFAGGEGQLFVELEATDGQLTGYIKPLFEDINVVSWEQDVEQQGDNPLELIWEGISGFVQTLMTNPSTDKFATQIDIEGSLKDAQIDSWEAAIRVVKNAFVDAIEARFENLTPLTGGEDEKAAERGGDKNKSEQDKEESAQTESPKTEADRREERAQARANED